MNTTEKLDLYADLLSAPDAIRLQKQALIDQVYTQEIKDRIAEIDAEFAPQLLAAEENAAALKAEIEAEVLAVGSTVKSSHLMAVWNKGRVSWDSKKLDGMMSLIPQLADARKEGEPTVSFRKV
jgi:hypothetical protein